MSSCERLCWISGSGPLLDVLVGWVLSSAFVTLIGDLLGLTGTVPSVTPSLQGQILVVSSEMCVLTGLTNPSMVSVETPVSKDLERIKKVSVGQICEDVQYRSYSQWSYTTSIKCCIFLHSDFCVHY